MNNVTRIHTQTDNMNDHEAAKWCANRIRDFWKARGYSVKADIVPVFVKGRGTLYTVKSDMINGYPKGYVQ